MSGPFETTWDGRPISRESPYGVAALVWRRTDDDLEWLVLHRAHWGPEFAGDWAWSPPGGARFPGEVIEETARRELLEETGLDLPLVRTDCGGDAWVTFAVEVTDDREIELSPEHDAYVWLTTEEACARCLPAVVGDGIRCVAASLIRG